MIDFQRTRIPVIYNDAITNRLDMMTTVNLANGEEVGSQWGQYGNLKFHKRSNGSWLTNSLHTCYNNHLAQNYKFNTDDFTLDRICLTIDHLSKELDIKWPDTTLTEFEYGFNIRLDTTVDDFLDRVISHKSANPNYDKCNANTCIKSFHHTNFDIKLYDKSKQFRINDSILRIELRMRSKQFRKLGVNSLADLKSKSILRVVNNEFLKRYDELIIIDGFEPPSGLSTKEREFFYKAQTPSYWRSGKKKFTRQTVSRRRKEFREMIEDLQLNQLKGKIRRQLEQKFDTLTSPPIKVNNSNYKLSA